MHLLAAQRQAGAQLTLDQLWLAPFAVPTAKSVGLCAPGHALVRHLFRPTKYYNLRRCRLHYGEPHQIYHENHVKIARFSRLYLLYLSKGRENSRTGQNIGKLGCSPVPSACGAFLFILFRVSLVS